MEIMARWQNQAYGIAKSLSKASIFAVALAFAVIGSASAQHEIEFHPDKRHHLSVVGAGSYVYEEDYTAATVGIDYEYRVSPLLGLGFVAERAFGRIDATTLLAVADIHIWRGLAIQTGPGIEIIDGEVFAAGRIGALYEFELEDHWTISPQVHFDISDENAIVFGAAFGRAF